MSQIHQITKADNTHTAVLMGHAQSNDVEYFSSFRITHNSLIGTVLNL